MPKFWKTATGQMLIDKKYAAAMILVAFLIIPCVARADTNIDNCTVLDAAGNYNLTANIINEIIDYDGTCIETYLDGSDAQNLNCHNYNVTGNSSTTVTGLYIENWPMTIENCNVDGWEYDMTVTLANQFEDGSNITIINNSISNLSLVSSLYNDTGFIIIKNNTITKLITAEIDPTTKSNILFKGNTINSNSTILMSSPSLSELWNDSQYGNFWIGFSDNDTLCDCQMNGICGNYYVIDDNNTDYLPLCTVAEQECVPSWVCEDWTDCVRGVQTRTCADENQCGNNSTMPALSQSCLKGLPNATYNISSDCCPISTFYCTDNETLVQLWNTSQGVSWAVEDCEFGCDNTTETCMPPSGQQNLLLFGVIVAFCVLGALFWRWSRR